VPETVTTADGSTIDPGALVGSDVEIGRGVVIRSGAEIDDRVVLEDGVEIGPGHRSATRSPSTAGVRDHPDAPDTCAPQF
jgi:UDP-3-O-[3-hydroxymyristoyl] glucosamine N-acyltransferase